jgi:crossover junction endodeoxyribonuclease RuvC
MNMIIFGIDPGSAVTGYGIIEVHGNRAAWLDSGVIRTGKADTLDAKLVTVHEGLQHAISQHAVDKVCVEKAFYYKNARTALILGHVRGVCLLVAGIRKLCVEEYTPRSIKKSITGNGSAEKQQVQYMIEMLLAPPRTHAWADAYDALAVALCGFYNTNSEVASIAAKVRTSKKRS